MRSIWKGPYINNNLYNNIIHNRRIIPIKDKSSVIFPEMINKEYKIYNGYQFKKLKILETMIGYKLGEFIFSKKRCVYRKKKKGTKKK
jgi:ribosomal protein S19